jgi:hypothetical protein
VFRVEDGGGGAAACGSAKGLGLDLDGYSTSMAPAPTPTPPTPTPANAAPANAVPTSSSAPAAPPIHELDPVVLTADLPEHGLAIGALGTVAKVLEDGAAFEVDFTPPGGQAGARVTVPVRRDQLRRSTGEDA